MGNQNSYQLEGTFDTLILPELTGNLFWDTTALSVTGNLNVVPEPTAAYLALCAFFAAKRRKKGSGLVLTPFFNRLSYSRSSSQPG